MATAHEDITPAVPVLDDKPAVSTGSDDGELARSNGSGAAQHDPIRATVPDRSGPKRKGLGPVALIFACGAALFSDGYVNASSGPVGYVLSKIYTDEQRGNFSQLFAALVFCGIVCGQLIFGVLSDRIGRKFGMIFCSVWLTVFSVLIAGAWGAGGSVGGLFAALIAYRFLQGIAIGGEYPAGSVASSENTESKDVNPRRQQMYFVLATNSMIDIGFVAANLVAFILYNIFGDNHLVWVWRLTLGLGAIPPLVLLFFRAKMEEPEHYKQGAIKRNLPWWLIIKKYWVRLTAVSICWFVYDWVAYPAGIYSSFFVGEIVPDGDINKSLGWATLINVFYLPGTLIGAVVADRLGPKNTMLIGLLCQSAVGFGLAGGFGSLRNNIPGLVVLYGIYVAFGEFGPGNCLGLLASKSVAPSAVRGTFYGIAAAIGKIGAYAATYSYTDIQNSVAPEGESNELYYTIPFYIGAALALVSALILLVFIPPVTQDNMRKIDADFFEYLKANGYDMANVGLLDDAGNQTETGRGTAHSDGDSASDEKAR